MIIETERLRLRPFKIEDAKWLFKATYNKDVKEYLPGIYTKSLKEAKNTIKYNYLEGDFVHRFYFIIENKENHKQLGFLDIVQRFDEKFEVAMFIAQKYRRKGYISEAINGFVKSLPSGRILRFCIRKDNKASLIAVQKLEKTIEVTPPDEKEYQIFERKT